MEKKNYMSLNHTKTKGTACHVGPMVLFFSHENNDRDSLGLEFFRIEFLWDWNASVEYKTNHKCSRSSCDKLAWLRCRTQLLEVQCHQISFFSPAGW